MGWAQSFTDELLALKQAGYEFDAAWVIAIKRLPAKTREIGGGGRAETLFELDEGDGVLRWFQERCRDAWCNAPAVRGGPSRLHLLPGLMGSLGADESRSARRVGYRAAA